MNITIENKQYTLDTKRSLELGVLTPVKRKVKFADIKIGEVFRFTPSPEHGKNVACLYIKTSSNYADRIASSKNTGMWRVPSKFENVVADCSFDVCENGCKYAVLRNGEYQTEIDI